jgi:O-antigen ligase
MGWVIEGKKWEHWLIFDTITLLLPQNMLQKIKNITPADLTIAAAMLLSVSMIFSPFLLSVGMWLIIVAALWEIKRVGRSFGASIQKLVDHRAFLMITLLFWVFALSFFGSEDKGFWLARTRIRIPFLVLPWAFANLPVLGFRRYAALIYVFVLVLVLFTAGSLLNFALDPDTILSGLGEGQPVPVPRNHIRFSLMIVLAIVSGGWLVGKADYWSSRMERNWFAGALIFLFLAVHILSVRSALIALYAALGFSVFRFLFLTKNWKVGILALVLLVLAPVIALNTVGSLKQRVAYMLYDWQHFRSAEGGESYSDSERFISLDVGARIWLDNKVMGVGVGDLEQETQRYTSNFHPFYAETPKLPHNQFIYILAGTGLIGLMVSLLALLYPLTIATYRKFYLFIVFQVIVFVSFLVEYTLETSIGAAFYLFYMLWWMRMAEEKGQ